MMVEWQCPHCKSKYYSSYEQGEKKHITCDYCDEKFVNPYFEGISDSRIGPSAQNNL